MEPEYVSNSRYSLSVLCFDRISSRWRLGRGRTVPQIVLLIGVGIAFSFTLTLFIFGMLDVCFLVDEIVCLPMAMVGRLLNPKVSVEQIMLASGVFYGFIAAFVIVRPKDANDPDNGTDPDNGKR